MEMIRKFIRYYRPHLKLFSLDMGCSLLVALCDLFYPTIAGRIINDFVPNRAFRLMLIWSVVLLAIYLLKFGLNWFIQYYGHVVGVRMQADMRRDVFYKLERLPFSYFDAHKTGTILSRIVNDLMDISELAHHGPENLFISLISLVGAFIILVQINLPLTLIIYLLLPIGIFFCIRMRARLNDAFRRTREEIAEVNAGLENSISGIRVTRSYTGAQQEEEKFNRANGLFVRARSDAYHVMADFHSSMTLFTDILYLTALIASGFFYFFGQISTGGFVQFLLYINMFLNPIRRLVDFVEQLQNGMTGFVRFDEIMQTPEEEEAPDAKELGRVQGSIQFTDVSFRYNVLEDDDHAEVRKEDRAIIDHLNLSIPAGRTVALVGPSGGGKTTLCHLIPRFYEISGGSITIDGTDIREVTRESLRKNIGMVAQDVFLFTGTIRDNIAYGRPDATDEEIIDAAKKARIHDAIMAMEDGYDTYIGERGVKLSGGQKQRVSIARVFLKNPAILILDEATSALDNATEMLIQESLEELSKGRTCIVVAHRLATIKNADEIVVLTDEGVKERGTHAELLAQNGIYAGFYRYQFRDADAG